LASTATHTATPTATHTGALPAVAAPSISRLPIRGRARARGYIDAVTILPAGASPRFTAIVTDADKYARPHPDAAPPATDQRGKAGRANGGGRGTTPRGDDRVRLVWLGQRQVKGIKAGTQLRFEGMVSRVDGLPTIYNPRYEIISQQEA
jgi:hypothetical protein